MAVDIFWRSRAELQKGYGYCVPLILGTHSNVFACFSPYAYAQNSAIGLCMYVCLKLNVGVDMVLVHHSMSLHKVKAFLKAVYIIKYSLV